MALSTSVWTKAAEAVLAEKAQLSRLDREVVSVTDIIGRLSELPNCYHVRIGELIRNEEAQ